MSTTVNLSEPGIVALNTAVSAQYGVRPGQVPSTNYNGDAKNMAVFILVHFMGYKPCDVARPYSINCLYVPTVVRKAKDLYGIDEGFRRRLHAILNEIEYAAC